MARISEAVRPYVYDDLQLCSLGDFKPAHCQCGSLLERQRTALPRGASNESVAHPAFVQVSRLFFDDVESECAVLMKRCMGCGDKSLYAVFDHSVTA